MTTEKEKELAKRFWFMKTSGDPKRDLLFFGCECGDGWFDLIWNLCCDIEKELKKVPNSKGIKYNIFILIKNFIIRFPSYIKENFKKIGVLKNLQRLNFNRKWYKKWYENISFIFGWFISFIVLLPNSFNKYRVYPFQVIQVKEKFGELRFYVNYGSDKIYDLIEEAEEKSAEICEICGKPGKLNEGNWLRTRCKNCN